MFWWINLSCINCLTITTDWQQDFEWEASVLRLFFNYRLIVFFNIATQLVGHCEWSNCRQWQMFINRQTSDGGPHSRESPIQANILSRPEMPVWLDGCALVCGCLASLSFTAMAITRLLRWQRELFIGLLTYLLFD